MKHLGSYDFIYVATCFVGGENLLFIHQNLAEKMEQIMRARLKESESVSSVKYAIVLGATTDYPTPLSWSAARRSQLHLKFFNELRRFMTNPRWYTKKTLKPSGDDMQLNNVLEPLLEMAGGPTGYQSICFPGSSFFRIVNLPQEALCLTWLNVEKAYRSNDPVIRVENREYFLIYPSHVGKVRLSFVGETIPPWISMIPGRSLHIIDQVILENSGFDILMHDGLFKPLLDELHGFAGLYNKAWFIKNLDCMNYEGSPFESDDGKLNIKGLVAFKYANLKTIPNFEILFKYRSNFYRAQASLDNLYTGFTSFNDDFKFNQISTEEYYHRIEEIKNATFPSSLALREVSGGNENENTLNAAYDGFISGYLNEKLRLLKLLVESGKKFGDSITLAQRCLIGENNEANNLSLELFAAAEKYLDTEVLARIKTRDFAGAEAFVNQLPDEISKISNKFPWKKIRLWFRTKSVPMLKNKLIIIATSWIEYDVQTATRLLQALLDKEIISAVYVCQLIDSMQDLDRARQLLSSFKSTLTQCKNFRRLSKKLGIVD